MKRIVSLSVAASILIVLTDASAFPTDSGGDSDPAGSPASHRVSEIKKQRDELIAELVAIRNTKFSTTWPTPENHYAARMLAKFRAPEGIEFLVQYVSYEESGNVSFHLGPLQRLPNWHALVEYGPEIGYTVVAHMAYTPSKLLPDDDAKFLAYALLSVYGGDEAGRAKIAGLFRQAENIAGTNNESLQRFEQVVAGTQPVGHGR